MSTLIELGMQTVNFGAVLPGDNKTVRVPLSVVGDQPITVTVQLASVINAGFVATIFFTEEGRSRTGPEVPVTVAVASASSSVGLGSSAVLSQPGQNQSYYLEIDWNAPTVPMPLAWDAIVTLSWDGGSTQLVASGQTAQLVMTNDAPSPVGVGINSPTEVQFTAEYDSVDPQTISVALGAPTDPDYPETGLTVSSSGPVLMPPTYSLAPPPKGSQQLPGEPSKVPTLNPHRSARVTILLGATSENYLGTHTAYVALTVNPSSVPIQPGLGSWVRGQVIYPLQVVISVD